jgi:methyltransferase (TIGR04290 family)
MKLVVLGLSLTSSWGNGHATTWRALLRAFSARGHEVLFLERDVPWYAKNRDLVECSYAKIALYADLASLRREHTAAVREADAVIIGSYVPEGVRVGEWALLTARGLVAFYDIDTPVTLAKLRREDHEYISPELIRRYPLYLSFSGGPVLETLEREFGSLRARALFCAVDPTHYFPETETVRWDLGYLGTYSADRQPGLDRRLVEPARRWPKGRFVVAGPQYPAELSWPTNVVRIEHLAPVEHRRFYNSQRFTLNLTRADMLATGHSPSVRLFEAAACGTPIITDRWSGLETLFLPGCEILVADGTEDIERILHTVSHLEAAEIGAAARARVLGAHTADHRAAELEQHLLAAAPVLAGSTPSNTPGSGSAGNSARFMVPAPEQPVGLAAEAATLAPWFHNLHLPDGTQTAPKHPLGDFPSMKWDQIEPHLPRRLAGWTVLDIGCNSGFYSIELAKRGALVTAIDVDPHFLRQARWAAGLHGLDQRITFRQAGVYDLARWDNDYDLVLFMGVYYHLRYPALGLDLAVERARRLFLFQTLTMPDEAEYETPEDQDFHDRSALNAPGWPRLAFIEKSLAGDPTNWWVPNHAGVVAMLRSAGLTVTSRPGHEIYLCEPTRLHDEHPPLRWDPAELDAACGRARNPPPKR